MGVLAALRLAQRRSPTNEGTPTMPETKQRNIRIADWLWDAVEQTASERNISASEVVRRALLDFVHADPDNTENDDYLKN
jgi:hypothetical protein